MRNLNVDVVLCPFLGLKLAPLHFALDGVLVLAEPALELGVGGHFAVLGRAAGQQSAGGHYFVAQGIAFGAEHNEVHAARENARATQLQQKIILGFGVGEAVAGPHRI